MRIKLFLLASALLAFTSMTRAEFSIEVVKGTDNATPIAIVPFGGVTAEGSDNTADIIRADLERSGLFNALAVDKLPVRPTSGGDMLYNEWKGSNTNYVVVGSVQLTADKRYEIRYEVFSVDRQTRLLGEKITVAASKWRDGAHHISDQIFEKIIGTKGAFSTRILYVNQFPQGGKLRYRLELSDADGQRPLSMLESAEPILSPSWSPDGQKVAYVSFENKRPAIYTQNIATRERKKITSFSGLNGAPAWSPDGRRMALTLSRDGNPEIYVMDIASLELTRLTNHAAIDTEARWMPDGQALIFTSDRSGNAQIYRLNVADKSVKRLTFEGSFNARADVSPDGRSIAFVHREKGQQFQIAVQDLQSNAMTVITQTPLDESPSFAPNGMSLVYATRKGKYGELGIASSDGRVQARLPARLGEIREPAWSPFLK